jgi:hypothetical protein
MTIMPVETFQPFARQMFEAVSAACALPDGTSREVLLKSLAAAVMAATHVPVMVTDDNLKSEVK